MTKNEHQLDRKNDLLRIGGATVLYLVPYAMLTPQVVVRLSEAGASATAVSAYGMTPFVLILGMSFVTPSFLRQIGMKIAHFIGLVVAALALLTKSLLLLADSTALTAYVGIAALLGFASALTWTATEATIATHAPADRIGSFTAVYQTGLGVSLAVGPFLPALFALTDMGLAIVTGLLMTLAIALATVSSSRGSSAVVAKGDTPAGRIVWRAVVMILAVALVGGWYEVGLNAVLPYIALDTGLSPKNAAMLVGVLATGALLIQLPIFFFSDRFGTNALYRGCALSLVLGGLLLGVASAFPHLLWLSAFVFGAGGGALYTLGMIEVARSRNDQPVAALTTLAISAYTLGAVVGPFSAGVALDLTGGQHVWIVLVAVPVVIFLMTFSQLSNQKKED